MTKMLHKNWLPRFGLGVWLQLLPLLVMFALLWISAWTPLHLDFNTRTFWEYLVYGWIFTAAVYLLVLVIIVKYLRAWWLAVAFAWFYLLLYAINAGFLYHAGSVLISPYFVWGTANLTARFAPSHDIFHRVGYVSYHRFCIERSFGNLVDLAALKNIGQLTFAVADIVGDRFVGRGNLA